MDKMTRREFEVRRLAASGCRAYVTKDLGHDKMFVTASVLPSGDQFLVQVDFYRVVGAFGDTVREEAKLFSSADDALDYLASATGVAVADLETG